MNGSFSSRDQAAARLDELQLVDSIAYWCEALQGGRPMREALEHLVEPLGAEIAVLSRLEKSDRGAARCVAFEVSPGAGSTVASFARDLLGEYLDRARPGTIWQATTLLHNDTTPLTTFQAQRRLQETVVIPIAREANNLDFLELHFAYKLSPRHHASLTMIAETLARTWGSRRSGVFLSALSKSRTVRIKETISAPILDFTNPGKLSRAEYRVCLLMSQGLSDTAIADELSISPSTLRTHLRNVYCKTGVSNRVELIYQLLAGRAATAAQATRAGAA